LVEARRDGGEHFPIELVKELPKNTRGYPFMRGTDFHSHTLVQLIPALRDPDGCKQIVNVRLRDEYTSLNGMDFRR
jgi:hypothetical protein